MGEVFRNKMDRILSPVIWEQVRGKEEVKNGSLGITGMQEECEWGGEGKESVLGCTCAIQLWDGERERERCSVDTWHGSLDLREEAGWKWTLDDLSHRMPEATGRSEISVGLRFGAPIFLDIY